MDANFLFEFDVNKPAKTITVKREFEAPLALVWRAWTEAELLDQWWGPQPFHVETKEMDFREGGHWLYAMVSPEGEKHWAKMSYERICLEEFFKGKDAFCDEQGNVVEHIPGMDFHNHFSSQGETTLVSSHIEFVSEEALEQTIAMGFKEGLTTAINQLAELLKTLK